MDPEYYISWVCLAVIAAWLLPKAITAWRNFLRPTDDYVDEHGVRRCTITRLPLVTGHGPRCPMAYHYRRQH